MDGQYSWKRTEDIEIDLADLMKRLCSQWKRMILWALLTAFILGGSVWLREKNSRSEAASEAEEAVDTEEMKEQVLTAAEEQEVVNAVLLEHEIKELEEYMNHSVLMKIDSYRKSKVIMLYNIDHAKRKELPVITECYLNFIVNGGAADVLLESGSNWKMEKSYLAELVSAYQKIYNSPYQIMIDDLSADSMLEDSLFYVEITGEDMKAAKKMALDMQNVLLRYSSELKENTGDHRLTLISCTESITADSGLQAQQHDKKALLSANKASLQTMTDAFSEEQMRIYTEAAGVEDKDSEKDSEENADGENIYEGTASDRNSVIKYLAAGFIGGGFIYCSIFLCWYLFRDTVKSIEEMKRKYTFPVYGTIMLPGKNGKKFSKISETLWAADNYEKEQVLNRVKLACKKQGITKLYAASDFTLEIQEKECLKSIAEQLKKCGIVLTVAENVVSDTGLWDELSEHGNVLMVCRIGTTTHRMIDDTMCFYLENDIAVTGAAVFMK